MVTLLHRHIDTLFHSHIDTLLQMKLIMMILLLLSGVMSRGQEPEGFRIIGNLGGSLGGRLFLVGSTEKGLEDLGETDMEAGKFEFTGKVNGLTLAYILTEERQPIATLMLENRIFTLQSGATGIEIYGGEQQQIWNQFEAVTRDISRRQMQMEQQIKAAYSAQNQLQLQTLQSEFEQYASEAQKKQEDLLRSYKDAPAAACFVATAMGQLDYKGLSELFGMLGEPASASFFGGAVKQRLAELRRLEVGGTAPDFRAATLNGDTVSLYGTEAKLKLLDFWASWCGACRQANPHVRKIYAKYHGAGLEIIGVSLDQQKQAWAKAIRDDKLTWVQVSDLGGWKSRLASLYNVKAVPCTYLLDENNRVVGKNLRGKELQKKIAEMLGD